MIERTQPQYHLQGLQEPGQLELATMTICSCYYTWSQGFSRRLQSRCGVCRSFGQHRDGFAYTYKAPQPLSRTLVNNEIGWKTQWFDRRLEFNGAFIKRTGRLQVQISSPAAMGT